MRRLKYNGSIYVDAASKDVPRPDEPQRYRNVGAGAATAGGDLSIVSGAGATTAAGGTLNLTAGQGGATGAGGVVRFNAYHISYFGKLDAAVDDRRTLAPPSRGVTYRFMVYVAARPMVIVPEASLLQRVQVIAAYGGFTP